MYYQWRVPIHPFTQRRLPNIEGPAFFRSPAVGALLAVVLDHCVQDRVVFPGTGYLELARMACSTASSISNTGLAAVFVLQPLQLQTAAVWVQCVVDEATFDVVSGLVEEDVIQAAVVHCKGEHKPFSANSWSALDLCQLRSGNVHAVETQTMYRVLFAGGMQYGPQFQRLAQVKLAIAVGLRCYSAALLQLF